MHIRLKTIRTILLIASALFLFGCNEPNKDEKILELKCGIKLKVVSWGLTGDNKATYISTNNDWNDTITEPYFRAIDFFYKVDEDCKLIVCKTDSLKRKALLDPSISLVFMDDNAIDYNNFKKLGYENVLYK